MSTLSGYLRGDGRKGIRNVVAVAYLVECAHHLGRAIVNCFPDDDVHLIGFPGCFPNAYAQRMMEQLCTHPNVGAVLLPSHGCESFDKCRLKEVIAATITDGRAFVAEALATLAGQTTVPMTVDELFVGTVCGGSDGASGITGNPAAGRAFDQLVAGGAACI